MTVEETRKLTLTQLGRECNFTRVYLSQLQFQFNFLPRCGTGYACYDANLCTKLLEELKRQQAKGVKLSYAVKAVRKKYKKEIDQDFLNRLLFQRKAA